MLPHITETGLRSTLDLGVRLHDVCKRIGRWNGIDFGGELDWLKVPAS
jgi:hypothetical protein